MYFVFHISNICSNNYNLWSLPFYPRARVPVPAVPVEALPITTHTWGYGDTSSTLNAMTFMMITKWLINDHLRQVLLHSTPPPRCNYTVALVFPSDGSVCHRVIDNVCLESHEQVCFPNISILVRAYNSFEN